MHGIGVLFGLGSILGNPFFLSFLQKLCLKNPSVLKYLGLPIKKASVTVPINDRRANNEGPEIFVSTKQGKISAENLSPKELVAVSDDVMPQSFSMLQFLCLNFQSIYLKTF